MFLPLLFVFLSSVHAAPKSFGKLIGSCQLGARCEETWAAEVGRLRAAVAAQCGAGFKTASACPVSAALLGHCEVFEKSFLRKIFYYGTDAAGAEASCVGRWIGPGP